MNSIDQKQQRNTEYLESLKPRPIDPGDYNRAQPVARDMEIVRAFIDREFENYEEDGYRRIRAGREVIERKLGLLVAMYFNEGHRVGKDIEE
jgi:hypothetical protein